LLLGQGNIWEAEYGLDQSTHGHGSVSTTIRYNVKTNQARNKQETQITHIGIGFGSQNSQAISSCSFSFFASSLEFINEENNPGMIFDVTDTTPCAP